MVVVVSAMGDTTEELLGLARSLSRNPDRRELDMLLSSGERISTALLALAIRDLGVEAISLTGAQSGIVTCDRHFSAEIQDVTPRRVHAELETGKVVVVAGYQGRSPEGETTTLGRGGSDTSAVALAGALGARRCEIFSDVHGVYSADPRIVERARPLERISYEEMIELARHGASVLHPGAVRLARDEGVEIRAACTFSEAPGTLVTARPEEQEPRFTGVAWHRDLIRVSLDPCDELKRGVLEAAGEPDVYYGGALDAGREDLLVCSDHVSDGDAFEATLAEEHGPRVRVERGLGSVSAVGWGVGSQSSRNGDDPDPRRSKVERLRRKVGVEDDRRFVASDHSFTFLTESEKVEDAARHLHGELVEPVLAAQNLPEMPTETWEEATAA